MGGPLRIAVPGEQIGRDLVACCHAFVLEGAPDLGGDGSDEAGSGVLGSLHGVMREGGRPSPRLRIWSRRSLISRLRWSANASTSTRCATISRLRSIMADPFVGDRNDTSARAR